MGNHLLLAPEMILQEIADLRVLVRGFDSLRELRAAMVQEVSPGEVAEIFELGFDPAVVAPLQR